MIRNIICNDSKVTQTWDIIDSNCVEVRSHKISDLTLDDTDFISEITGVFTTSNPRIRLYKLMDWLDASQIAYCDTDSVMFLYDETNPKHKSPYTDQPPEGICLVQVLVCGRMNLIKMVNLKIG